MALVINDRVKETSTTTGTGTLSLAGAVVGFETFVAGIGSTNTTYYCIYNQGSTEFEVGIGTVTDATPDTLSRDTILSSSNSDAAVNFSAGTKDVFCTLPASKAVIEDASNNVVLANNLTVGALLKMPTNTANKILVADGTSFEEVDMSGDATIAAGGAVTVSQVSALSGNLDTNNHNIIVDDAHGIIDDSSNEYLKFTKTGSAVNEITIKNQAACSPPEIQATGGDSNIDLKLVPKGTGKVDISGIKYPTSDGDCGQVLTTNGSGVLSFANAGGGSVSWQTGSIKTSNFSPSAGEGYFVNTTSGAITATLPASPSVGDIIAFKDYAATFGTNNLTIARNGKPIESGTKDAVFQQDGGEATLIYQDATAGWLIINHAQKSDLGFPEFITATGGTANNCGNYKVHVFTSPGCFSVSAVGNAAGSENIDYMIVGGGGPAGPSGNRSGGGGGGGWRASKGTASGSYYAGTVPVVNPVSPVPVSVSNYPVTVGGTSSTSSAFGVTSAGGGTGAGSMGTGGSGGSGGGYGGNNPWNPIAPGLNNGNQPPVSPPQGNPGGYTGGGGSSWAGAVNYGFPGGGQSSAIYESPSVGAPAPGGPGCAPIPGNARSYAGGGAGEGMYPFPYPSCNPESACRTIMGQSAPAGSGGGGGAARPAGPGPSTSGTGASGVVMIRYKFQ